MKLTNEMFEEAKKFITTPGNRYENERLDFFAFIRADKKRVFCINGEYKFFKSEDDFIKACVKVVVTGKI